MYSQHIVAVKIYRPAAQRASMLKRIFRKKGRRGLKTVGKSGLFSADLQRSAPVHPAGFTIEIYR